MEKDITKYIKTALEQGYTESQIKRELIKSNYDKKLAEELIKRATSKKRYRLSKMLYMNITIAVIIILLVGGIIIYYQNKPTFEYYYAQAKLFYELKEYDKSIRELEKAIEIRPNNYYSYLYLGLNYDKKEDFDKAEESFKKAIELNQTIANAYYSLGRIYYRRGHSELKKNPKSEVAYKDFELSIINYERAIELRPDNYDYLTSMGWSYLGLRQNSEAEKYFKKSLELNPDSYDPYRGLGWAYAGQNKLKEAKEMFEKARELGFDVTEDRKYSELINRQ